MSEKSTDLTPDALLDQTASDNPEPRCPFASERRLSIAHLMVWAACVAVYMSAYRTIALDRMPQAAESLQTAVFGAWGVLGGSYLAGLLLFIVRRTRGQKFPRSGGEILWIIGGISVLQGLVL